MSTDRLQQLEAMYADNPQELFVLYALALEHVKLNNEEQSVNYFEKVLSVSRSYLPVFYQYALFLQDIDLLKARKLCQEGLLLAENQRKQKTKAELQSLLEQLSDGD
ncbi:MAG TPA: tetratricopeptide repeat protein [Bacteroidia bacterium]|jgi:tetratricopeptide (TPR) repeat protein|nr:tetratricopeptide repeat protein [Bacteroidia bacterium]HMU20008.1 tetratricopeptide repeat protein [Bacteroidia bacterium]